MRIRDTFPWEKQPKDIGTFFQWVRAFIAELATALNGGLTFGDGTDQDNITGAWVTVADTGAANTEFTAAHNLGAVPAGFILMVPPASGYVYNGSTSWDETNIYLKCSAANQAVRVFVLSPRVDPA